MVCKYESSYEGEKNANLLGCLPRRFESRDVTKRYG